MLTPISLPRKSRCSFSNAHDIVGRNVPWKCHRARSPKEPAKVRSGEHILPFHEIRLGFEWEMTGMTIWEEGLK